LAHLHALLLAWALQAWWQVRRWRASVTLSLRADGSTVSFVLWALLGSAMAAWLHLAVCERRLASVASL